MSQYSRTINETCKISLLEMENDLKRNINMHDKIFVNLVGIYCIVDDKDYLQSKPILL